MRRGKCNDCRLNRKRAAAAADDDQPFDNNGDGDELHALQMMAAVAGDEKRSGALSPSPPRARSPSPPPRDAPSSPAAPSIASALPATTSKEVVRTPRKGFRGASASYKRKLCAVMEEYIKRCIIPPHDLDDDDKVYDNIVDAFTQMLRRSPKVATEAVHAAGHEPVTRMSAKDTVAMKVSTGVTWKQLRTMISMMNNRYKPVLAPEPQVRKYIESKKLLLAATLETVRILHRIRTVYACV